MHACVRARIYVCVCVCVCVCSGERKGTYFISELSPFLIGRMFLREPRWKYSAKLVGS